MMRLIRFLDKIYNAFHFISIHKKFIKRLMIGILAIMALLFASYSPRELSRTILLKSRIMSVKNDSINYLLKIIEKRDSISINNLRHIPSLQPIRGNQIVAISTRYGMRTDNVYGMDRFHNGIDFAAQKGTPIFSDADGIVIDSGFDNAYGNHVQINHLNGYVSFYGHMNTRKVINGQNVLRGDIIGTVGSTGVSTGYHLHYKITHNGMPVNPTMFQQKKNNI